MHELMFQAVVKGMSERSELIPCIYIYIYIYIYIFIMMCLLLSELDLCKG